ncbi:MAG: hypothetical protein AAF799_43170 [Myxococcota bacterium]
MAGTVDRSVHAAGRRSAGAAIKGCIRGHDGHPMKAGVVWIGHRRGGDHIVHLDDDGCFALSELKPGWYWMRLAGVDHATKLGAFIVGDRPVVIDGRLGTDLHGIEPGREVRAWVSYKDGKGGFIDDADVDEALVESSDGRRTLQTTVPEEAATALIKIESPSGFAYNFPAGSSESERFDFLTGAGIWTRRTVEPGQELSLEFGPDDLPPAGLRDTISVARERPPRRL